MGRVYRSGMSACIGVWVYTYSGIRILVHVGALVCVLLRYSVCGCVNSTWNFYFTL